MKMWFVCITRFFSPKINDNRFLAFLRQIDNVAFDKIVPMLLV